VAVKVLAVGRTDIGCVRGNNEDNLGGDEEHRVYVVCDGMGGVAGGEVASAIAVEGFVAAVREEMAAGGGDEEAARNALFHATLTVNRMVRERAAVEPQLRGMGATLVAAQVTGDRLLVVNVGDSRAYLVRGGESTQLTQDHTFLSEQVRMGSMTQEMADASPMQSVISRAIGIEDLVEPDLFGVDLEDGDVVVLCSDGLTRYVGGEEIAGIVSGAAEWDEMDARCGRLIETAKERGGVDNVTCVLLGISVG
jgi:serine/threonine protein phosphatase PrpC